MRLSVRGLVIASGLLWGGCLLIVGLIHLISGSYGGAFLSAMSSVYPFFHGARSLGDVFIGTVCGLIDGGIAGLLFGWLYNAFAGRAS